MEKGGSHTISGSRYILLSTSQTVKFPRQNALKHYEHFIRFGRGARGSGTRKNTTVKVGLTEILIYRGGGDDITADPGVSKNTVKGRIRPIFFGGGGYDITIDPGVSHTQSNPD